MTARELTSADIVRDCARAAVLIRRGILCSMPVRRRRALRAAAKYGRLR